MFKSLLGRKIIKPLDSRGMKGITKGKEYEIFKISGLRDKKTYIHIMNDIKEEQKICVTNSFYDDYMNWISQFDRQKWKIKGD